MLSFHIATRFLRKSPVQSILIAAGIALGQKIAWTRRPTTRASSTAQLPPGRERYWMLGVSMRPGMIGAL